MKKITVSKIVIIAIVSVCFAATGALYAGTQVADVIKMENPAYKHKKGIVEFTHKKHAEEYGAKCGDCHHDENGKPLMDLKMGDDVKNCFECHNKPGDKPKGKKAKGLSQKDKLMYHAHAIHENCKDCHKDYNKKNKTKKAPTTCSKCHPKKK